VPSSARSVGITRASFRRMSRLQLAVVSLFLAVSGAGCAGTITADGIDGFTVNSAHWLIFSSGGARTHQLVATSVSQYCTKRRTAEVEAQDAFEAHQTRLSEGTTQCESLDTYYDDLANAFNPVANPNASYLRINIERDVDSQDQDVVTAPAAGSYVQLGGGGDGTFVANVEHHESRFNDQLAEAWDCEELDPSEMDDLTALSLLLAESTASVDFPTTYQLSAGELDITENGDNRDVDVDGDILEDNTTIGDVSASFNASQCDIELADELSF